MSTDGGEKVRAGDDERITHTLTFYMADFYYIYFPERGAVLRVSSNASL